MKRVCFVPILVGLALILVTAVAHADGEKDARRAIQARYDQFDNAYMKKDFKTVGEVFSPDCVLTLNSEGRSKKAPQVVKGMQSVSKSLTVTHVKTRIRSIKVMRDTYEVTATWTGDSKYVPLKKSKEDPARKAKTTQSYRDTWKKTGKSWQIVHRIIE